MQAQLTTQRLANEFGYSVAAAFLVAGIGELTLNQNRIKGHAVGGGENLSADDIGAGGGAGASQQGQETRMIGRIDGELGDGSELVGGDISRNALRFFERLEDQVCMLQLVDF